MMTADQSPRNVANQVTIIRALSSITIEQAEEITRVVRAAGSAWDAQISDDYNGYLGVLVTPNSDGETRQRSLFVSGTAQRLELFEMCNDDLAPIGIFGDVDSLTARLLSRIVE